MKYLNLSQASRLCPGQVSPPTLWRWCRRGLRIRGSKERITLFHVRVGWKIYTTQRALSEFFCKLANADREHFQQIATHAKSHRPEDNQRSLTRDDAYCEAHGF
jgi:hypothetical protein